MKGSALGNYRVKCTLGIIFQDKARNREDLLLPLPFASSLLSLPEQSLPKAISEGRARGTSRPRVGEPRCLSGGEGLPWGVCRSGWLRESGWGEVSWGDEHILAGRMRGPSPDGVRRHPHGGSMAQQDRRASAQQREGSGHMRRGALGVGENKRARWGSSSQVLSRAEKGGK